MRLEKWYLNRNFGVCKEPKRKEPALGKYLNYYHNLEAYLKTSQIPFTLPKIRRQEMVVMLEMNGFGPLFIGKETLSAK